MFFAYAGFMDQDAHQVLIERMKREAEELGDGFFPVYFNAQTALAMLSNLQLALRHPGNNLARCRRREEIDLRTDRPA